MTDHVPAADEGLPFDNRPGGLSYTDPLGMVANLSSLFTVCALALEGATEWRGDIRDRVTEDVKHVLHFAALIAETEVLEVVAKAVEAKKGGVS